MKDHGHWMRLALALAKKGQGRTSPNPMVGAVLVRNRRLLASGYHHRYGANHAEVDCLKKVHFKAPRGSILYVTLEPCCHHGHTPPCTDAILKSGVRHVVVATRDPNSQVMGKGIQKLKRSGIKVTVGVLQKEARAFNRFYFCWREKHRPYVILKAALTLDGKVGMKSGASKWITGPEARAQAHRLRSEVDAILVGIGTVLADNPSLSVRHVPLRDPAGRSKAPIKVILDSSLRTPPTAKILTGAPTLIVCSATALQSTRAKVLQARGAELFAVPFAKILSTLAKRNMLSLLVEGGPQVYSSFLAADAIDELMLFVAPKVFGASGMALFPAWSAQRLNAAKQFRLVETKRCGEDLQLRLRPISL